MGNEKMYGCENGENGDAFANRRPIAALQGNVRLRAGDPRSRPVLLGCDEFLLFSLQLTPRHLVRRAQPKGLSGLAVINAVR
jgi:hypothetical protein